MTANGTTKDVLYEGQSQTSDLPASGNPITYYNGKDYTFTWTKGRQLASATVDGKQVSYTYDMSGVRTSKTVNGTTYNYTTLSGKVMRQQWGNKSLEFIYDDGNQPFAMIYNDGSTSTLYYYVLNAQGDVIALLNANGTLAASYNYGAWGNYSVHGADGKKTTDATFIGHINPLRYRGYYYDRETRLYYLQSRYYDFANCRFINADGLFTDGFIGANLFAYCANNPVNTTDPTGNFAITATVALITFGVALVATALAVGISSSPGFQGAVNDLCGAVSEAVGNVTDQIKDKLSNSYAKIKKAPNYKKPTEDHHVVAQNAPKASSAREILSQVGIGINSQQNMMPISTGLHRRLHTNLYYEWVNGVIISAYNSAGGDAALQRKNVEGALAAIKSFIIVLDGITPKF